MKRYDEEQLLVKRYLLGYLDRDAQERLEESFISDSGYREKVLTIEDELIDDYLANELSSEEREKFVEHFLSTPQQRERVKVARALHQFFSVEAATHSPPVSDDAPEHVSAKPLRPSFLRFRNPLMAASLAALLILVVGGSWLLISRRQRQGDIAQEQDRNRKFQSELARLNATAPNQGQPEAGVLSLTLPPLAFRGGGDMPLVHLPADSVQLSLVLPTDNHMSYRVFLQKSGDAHRFVVDGLTVRDTEGGKAVLLKVPARYLSRGDYLLELSALNDDGRFEPVAGYTFRALD